MLRAAVLGSPISHTLSPRLHAAAYGVLDLTWDYTAIECSDIEFPAFFAAAGAEWMGMSLTMPLKEVVFDVVANVDDVARAVGSANTIFRTGAQPEAPWQATNTDIVGMVRALGEQGVVGVESAVVLGAGATARSALAALAAMGADRVRVHARRPEPREHMADLGIRLGLDVSTCDLDPQPIDADLLISTLPADAAAAWTRAQAQPMTSLLDASYHPWPTPLALAWAQERPNAAVANGRDMLLWQAVAQVGWMTGRFDPGAIGSDPLARTVAHAMATALGD